MCERLTEFDELVVSWRLRHIQLVERIIGIRMGTGGSSGASYLKLTLDKKFFPNCGRQGPCSPGEAFASSVLLSKVYPSNLK